jgi:hypothetical protein
MTFFVFSFYLLYVFRLSAGSGSLFIITTSVSIVTDQYFLHQPLHGWHTGSDRGDGGGAAAPRSPLRDH